MRSYNTLSWLLVALCINIANAVNPIGCYSLIGTSSSKQDTYMSSGKCKELCPNSPYMATQGFSCFCLSSLPSSKVGDSSCSTTCPGFSSELCGSDTNFSVYRANVMILPLEESSGLLSSLSLSLSDTRTLSLASSPATSSLSTHASDPAQLQTATHLTLSGTSLPNTSSPSSPSTDASNGSKSQSKTNTAAIAGGVVGGLAAGIGIALLAWFWLRRRDSNNRYELDEETYFDKGVGDSPSGMNLAFGSVKGPPPFLLLGSRKAKSKAAPMDMPLTDPFANPPNIPDPATNPAAGGLLDPRMNPTMMGRQRLSAGLLADEADYLRKILQVANPDGFGKI